VKTARLDAPVTGGDPKAAEGRLMDNLMHQQELIWTLDQTKRWLEVTDNALKGLPREERLILQRLYICPEKGAIDRLCEELEMERSSVYRHRDQALQSFATALYGFPES
jgi:hypothetical protein